MKFVTLALALLLAIGSQAASLQPDGPNPLQHFRSMMDLYMDQVRNNFKNALEQLDEPEFAELKARLSQYADTLYDAIMTAREGASGATDTLFEATADVRNSIQADFDALAVELDPKKVELMEVLQRHFQQYQTLVAPLLKEYHDRQTAGVEAMKTRLPPIVEELKQKGEANWEETKRVLMPMITAINDKVQARLEALRRLATPYVEEYKEQVRAVVSQARNMDSTDLSRLRESIEPLTEEIKQNFQKIFELVSESFNKPALE